TVPELGAADLFFGQLAGHVTLEHDVAVVRRADDLPTVLGELVEEVGDLGESFGSLGDVLTEPSGRRALASIAAIDLVANGAEDVDEDVRGGRRHFVRV